MEYCAIVRAMSDFLVRLDELPHTLSPMMQDACEDIFELLRVGRLDVTLYENRGDEAAGKGRSMTLYSSGFADERHYETFHKVNGKGSPVVYKVFRRFGEPLWNDKELDHIAMAVSLVFLFNTKSCLTDNVEYLTFHDTDLGVYNLKHFMRYTGRLIESDEIYGYTAIYFNIKKFSAVNQRLGRRLGTLIMHRFIEAVSSLLSPDEMLGRIGGDNFIMLIRQEDLNVFLAALRGTDIVYDDRTGESVSISATVGIYEIKREIPVHSPPDIMDRVSIAESVAKSRTKHDFAYYDMKMREDSQRVININAQFEGALANEEFLVYYQPKVSMNDYRIVGAEALCRWMHNGELIPPNDFIPVLEKGSDICRLDFYMLDKVCRDIRRWLDSGMDIVKVSVNLSRRHLADAHLLEHIVGIVDRNNVPHEYIEVELTETTTDVEFKDLKRVIGGLQATGISTSVDDFGIGYSSLTLIKDIPWNVLKVDKSFLPLDENKLDDKKKVMFKHIVAMAQAMGLECVAEGVETWEQVELLKANCCNIAQGYYFDRPLPVADFEGRLRGHDYRKKL
ncbi:MAG: EAL domain-containing protein [Ruminococcus sp.]|nr:EAL domain-containing protein [Ruminococcus sp.]